MKKIRKRLEELGIFPEEGMVTLSRKLMEGRSLSRINGETVNMATSERCGQSSDRHPRTA